MFLSVYRLVHHSDGLGAENEGPKIWLQNGGYRGNHLRMRTSASTLAVKSQLSNTIRKKIGCSRHPKRNRHNTNYQVKTRRQGKQGRLAKHLGHTLVEKTTKAQETRVKRLVSHLEKWRVTESAPPQRNLWSVP